MFNIFTFTKAVTNASKLGADIKANATFGSVYNYLSVKGNQVTIHFTQNLSQEQIDALSAFMSSFSNVSIYDTLFAYLKSDIDPFVEELLVGIRAENIALGITQLNKTADTLGFFEAPITLPGRTRPVSLNASLATGSLSVTVEILNHLITVPETYADLSPFVTAARLTEWRDKIIEKLS